LSHDTALLESLNGIFAYTANLETGFNMIYGEMQLPRAVLYLDGELEQQKAGGFEHEVEAAALSLSRSP
jgi:hypothetical protein